mmetsp:Transcript_87171/g.232392  ORF Transcript_87171/g.232392 Transcript_87171/m.232392 type:complete len:236 (+) Transcript_87171:220-927(+)
MSSSCSISGRLPPSELSLSHFLPQPPPHPSFPLSSSSSSSSSRAAFRLFELALEEALSDGFDSAFFFPAFGRSSSPLSERKEGSSVPVPMSSIPFRSRSSSSRRRSSSFALASSSLRRCSSASFLRARARAAAGSSSSSDSSFLLGSSVSLFFLTSLTSLVFFLSPDFPFCLFLPPEFESLSSLLDASRALALPSFLRPAARLLSEPESDADSLSLTLSSLCLLAFLLAPLGAFC